MNELLSNLSNLLESVYFNLVLFVCTMQQGLGIKRLHIVFTALIVSRVLYMLSLPGVASSSDLLNKIDSILRTAHKFGYTTEVLKVTDMLQNADNKLFSLMFRSGHCLHTLLPDLLVIDIVLRNSGTSFNLPHCSYKLYKQSFVNRCLFRGCYWHVLLCGTYYLI